MSRYRDKSLREAMAVPLPVVIPVDSWGVSKTKGADLGTLADADTGYLQTVRAVQWKDVAGKMRVFTPQQLDWFQTAAGLVEAFKKDDRLAAEKMFARLLVLYRDVKAKRPASSPTRPKDDPSILLAQPEAKSLLEKKPEFSAVWVTQFLSKFLSRARFVYWVRGEGSMPQPAIYCPDLYMAVVVHVLLDRTFRICPHCMTTFVQRPNQPKEYCSLRCQGAHRQARLRRRRKEGSDVHLQAR